MNTPAQTVDRQGSAAGLQCQGIDIHHGDGQGRVALGQHGTDDAGAAAKVEQLARYGGRLASSIWVPRSRPSALKTPGRAMTVRVVSPAWHS